MDLSQQSITGRRFDLNRRGYDPGAVDTHLADIASAVASRDIKMAELEASVASLEAKVQDADESEEALRLTLKAAAHAKQELLAGAREEVETMEREASAKADKTVEEANVKAASIVEKATADSGTLMGETEGKAASLIGDAQTRAAAMADGARQQAANVVTAALAESETLVARIEDLRQRFGEAEEALAALQSASVPHADTAREALEGGLEMARETVDDPEILAAMAVTSVVTGADDSTPSPAASEDGRPEHVESEHVQTGAEIVSTEDASEPDTAQPDPEPVAHVEAEPGPVTPAEPVTEPPVEQAAEDQDTPEQSADDQLEAQPERHLEVVEPAESSSDISDKVDRLLEELREVT